MNELPCKTSAKDDAVIHAVLSSIALASIFIASPRDIGLFGQKSPSSYPSIHHFSEAKVIYGAYQSSLSTSGNPASVPR